MFLAKVPKNFRKGANGKSLRPFFSLCSLREIFLFRVLSRLKKHAKLRKKKQKEVINQTPPFAIEEICIYVFITKML
jgi:hypothetical protein